MVTIKGIDGMKCIIRLPYLWLRMLPILLGIAVFFLPLGNMDELWNYNFARCLVDGLDLYTEVSLLQTPASVFAAAPFVALFGGGLWSFRVAGFVLMVCVLQTIVSLMRQITSNASLILIVCVFAFALLFSGYYYNYNCLSMWLLLCLVRLWIRGDFTRRTAAMSGLLFGLLPLVKQSTGLALLAVCWGACLLGFLRRRHVALCCWCGACTLIPLSAFAAWLWIGGRAAAFWDYAVSGIASFSHRIRWLDFALSDPVALVVTMVVACLVGHITYLSVRRRAWREPRFACFVCAVVWLGTVTYPLADWSHVAVGIVPLLVVWFLFAELPSVTRLESIVVGGLAGVLAGLTVLCGLPLDGEFRMSTIPQYEWIPIRPQLEERIAAVDAYVQAAQCPVRIADAYACIYHIPLNVYYRDWDMLLKGNLGTKSIEDLLQLPEDTLLLVPKDLTTVNYQSHFALLEYIKSHYTCVDEVLDFEVYKKAEPL